MGIPTTSKWVQLDLLHPRFRNRLEKFFADPRIKGKVSVCSGVRPYAEQKRLYDGYRAGTKGFNLAANPDWARPGGFFHGSFHQEQKDGFGYAVDFRNLSPKVITNDEINDIAEEYGIKATIKNKEWWHHQPRNERGWFKPTAFKETKADTKKPPQIDWAAIIKAIEDQGKEVSVFPLRRGAKGASVKTAQIKLNHLGFECGLPDGLFGRKTKTATMAFQRWQGLKVDGTIGGNTWARLFNPVLDSI